MPLGASGNATPGPSTRFAYTKPLNLIDCGSTPGVLDPSQKSRILRDSNATLHFSAFDPLTASGLDAVLNLRKLSLSSLQEKNHPPKRIVIEISGSGKSSWRFVPRARTEDGVEGEGIWPRVVDLCGRLAFCSRDQWDIYKLDPHYDCTVRAAPALSTIGPAQPTPRPESYPLRKRACEREDTLEDIPHKRIHYDVTMESIRSTEDEDGDDEDDEVAVAEMITDEHHYRNPTPATTRPRRHANPTIRPRRVPVTPKPAKPVSQAADPSHPVGHQQARQSQSVPPESQKKRKEIFESNLNTPLEEDDEGEEGPKRKRVYYAPSASPVATQRELRAKKRGREEQKRKRREAEQKARILQREQELLEEIMNAVPPPPQPQTYWHSHPSAGPGIDRDSSMRGFSDYEEGGMKDDKPPAFATKEEAERAAAIEESRRKLAELEADRPIWETAARERRAREEAEEAQRQARLDAKRRREEEHARQEREKLHQGHQEAGARLRRQEAEKAARRSQRASERQARRDRWTSGRWTTARAVQRYNETSDLFDMARFSEEDPLTIDDVPWPTLRHPDAFSLPEDVDWESVEQFFEVLKHHMRTQDYVTVVQKSLHRFHPDRWKGRGLFKSVADLEEREWMDVAVNTVSQALAPIWTKVKSLKQA